MSRTSLTATGIFLLAAPILAAGDGERIPNWAAPPFWTPPSAYEQEERAFGREPLATDALAIQALPSEPMPFVAITPCRLADTRGNGFTGSYGPPALVAGSPRSFPITGQCGIPSGAGAVSFNVTVTGTLGAGMILAYPTGGPQPSVSTLNYILGQTVANAAIVPLSTGGAATFLAGSHGTQLILDVNGYYAPQVTVSSVFGRTGAVVAAYGDYTGTQVTNTPAGGIASATVQAAVNELDTEKSPTTHAHAGTGITGLTSGGITFGNSLGNLGQSAASLFWDQTNSRLGIGTSVPYEQVEVTGNIRLPVTTATTGQIKLGADILFHAYGNGNIFVGTRAGNLTMTGSLNTALGANALKANTGGAWNTAIGQAAMSLSEVGDSNTAVGYHALRVSTSGDSNTAVGAGALDSNVLGTENIAVGNSAGTNITGSYNIDIGSVGVAAESNTTRIGSPSQYRTFISGIRGRTTDNANAVTVLIDSAGQLGTVSSSIRFKDDVRDMAEASAGLFRLRPVTFRYKGRPDVTEERHYGLIAEEVNEVIPELVARSADGEIETVKYHELPAMLLNEMQKMAVRVGEAERRAEEAEAEIRKLQGLVETLMAGRGPATSEAAPRR